jgi:tetratricopeptide (TPR) repeat protein
VIHNDVELPGGGVTIAAPNSAGVGPGPIYLQDRGNPVRFRNIWVEVDSTDYLARANIHLRQANLDLARSDYEQLIRQSPDEHYWRGMLAAICLALGDDAEYRRHCQYFQTHFDEVKKPHERLHLLRILFLTPEAAQGWSAEEQQRIFAAERDSEWKDRVAILWHYRHGRWQQAIEVADRYLATHQAWRERAQCMVLRAMALQQKGDKKRATDQLLAVESYVFQHAPESAKWTEAANLLFLQIFYREATALIRRKNEELNFVSDWLEQPRSVLDSAITANPNDANGYKQRGLWYAARRQWNAALSDLLEAHRHDPSNAPLTAQLATVCLLLEDKQAYAIHGSKLEQSVDRTETPWHELQVLTLCPPLAGMKPNRWLTKLEFSIRRQDPTEIVSRRFIAVLYRNGRWDECISAVEKLYPDGPQMLHHAVTWLFRAMALNQRGDAEKAKQALRQIQAFIQEQKPESYLGPHSSSTSSRDVKLGNWFAFDGAHVQILYREAAELILGRREEVAVAPAIVDTAAAPVSQELTYLEWSIESLNATVEANSQTPDAWIRRSRWHLVRQNWKEARADCEHYLQLKPDNMWVRREHLDICMALEEKNPRSYHVVAEYVRSLPAGRFALGDLRSLCLIPTPPEIAPRELASWAARSGHPKTISANVYLPAVHYRAGDWQTCAAAAAQTFPNGPQGLFQVVPCLFEAAALKQLGKETEARAKLAKIRDFVEKGKSTSYPGKRDEVILNLTFDTLHSQILFREASALILGTRDELKAPLALEIVNRESSGK